MVKILNNWIKIGNYLFGCLIVEHKETKLIALDKEKQVCGYPFFCYLHYYCAVWIERLSIRFLVIDLNLSSPFP